ERLLIAIYAMARIERALAETIAYVKERRAFGQRVIYFQNTQFELAECKTEAVMARVFIDHCIERHLKGELDTATASMAKYRLTDLQCGIIDRCLQLYGGCNDQEAVLHAPRRWHTRGRERMRGTRNTQQRLIDSTT